MPRLFAVSGIVCPKVQWGSQFPTAGLAYQFKALGTSFTKAIINQKFKKRMKTHGAGANYLFSLFFLLENLSFAFCLKTAAISNKCQKRKTVPPQETMMLADGAAGRLVKAMPALDGVPDKKTPVDEARTRFG